MSVSDLRKEVILGQKRRRGSSAENANGMPIVCVAWLVLVRVRMSLSLR